MYCMRGMARVPSSSGSTAISVCFSSVISKALEVLLYAWAPGQEQHPRSVRPDRGPTAAAAAHARTPRACRPGRVQRWLEEADDDGLARQPVVLSPQGNPQHAAAAARCPCACQRRGGTGCNARLYGLCCRTARLEINLMKRQHIAELCIILHGL